MLYELLAQHANLIREVTIERFRAIEAAHELRASITLRDGSVLHVRDYVFRDGTREYAYHLPRPLRGCRAVNGRRGAPSATARLHPRSGRAPR